MHGSITEQMGFRRFDNLDYRGFDNLNWLNANGPSSDQKPGFFGTISNLVGEGGLQTQTVVKVSDASMIIMSLAIGAGITIGAIGWFMIKKFIG